MKIRWTVPEWATVFGAALTGVLLLETNLYSQSSNGVVFKSIYAFGRYDGYYPVGKLLLASDGNMYGTTLFGGALQSSSIGTFFRITADGALNTLASFSMADSAYPSGELVQAADGNIYGTSYGHPGINGGIPNYGTVFQLSNGVVRTFYTFSGLDGYEPKGLLQANDGNLYGTTEYGGPNFTAWDDFTPGTVFRLTTNGVLTTIYSFTGASDGSRPTCLVKGSDGNLYGTTDHTMFRMTIDGTLTTLYSVGFNNFMQGNDGYLYGIEGSTIFRISTNGGGAVALYTFPGGALGSGLTQLADGFLYATAYPLSGGFLSGNGLFCRLTTAGALTALYSFTGGSGGSGPQGIVQGSDGNLYGSTFSGGPLTTGFSGYGILFRLVLTPPPAIRIPPKQLGGKFTFFFQTFAGANYAIEQNTNSLFDSWVPYTNFAGDGSLFRLIVPTSNSDNSFFRVRQP